MIDVFSEIGLLFTDYLLLAQINLFFCQGNVIKISSSLCFSSGSQHSGTGEEDFNTSNDTDLNHQEHNERSDDEDGIDCHCTVCDRQFHDIDQ